MAFGWVGKVDFHAAPRPPVVWPHQVGVLPRQAACFQDRATVHQLQQAMDSTGTVALVGPGGVGKTQLAAHQARSLWQAEQLDLLVWITATTRDAVITGYAQAAVEILGADPTSPEPAAHAFLAWLEPKPGATRRWLVVLDDVTDPAELRGLWPAVSSQGRTLVTTRRRDAALAGHTRQVPVDLFTKDEATAYLTTVLAAHSRHEPPDQLAGLAGTLGHLPLALSQAAAYLVDLGLDCTAYRHQLEDRARTLKDTMPASSGLPDDQATTVAAAWSLSIDHADRLPPPGLARPMLQLSAMLDPNGIPDSVLTSPPALAHLARHRTAAPEQTHDQEVTALDAAQALRALHRLSLIDHTANSPHHTVRVHSLLQRAVREHMSAGCRDQLARTAADALTAAWPEIERDTNLAQALRANAEALTLHAEDALHQDSAHDLLFRTGRSFGEAGHIEAAIQHFQHLVSGTQHRLGPDHSYTLAARGNLAHWRGEAGDAAGAASAFEQLLADRERILGPLDPQTVAARGNLARWRGMAGDAAGAVEALEQLLADRERVLGPDHPGTLTARNNLAEWRGLAGDAAGAASAFEELLDDFLRVLGPDHPNTLAIRGNLASWRGEAGDAAGAAEAYDHLLDDFLRVLGPDHPHTLGVRNHLARWRGAAGDAAGAAATYEQLLDDFLRVRGPDHPDALNARANLAHWRGEAGDAAGAAAAYEQLLNDFLRVLGPDHPDTLNARANLADAWGWAGDAAGAVTAYEQLRDDFLRVLGPDHPHTLTIRNNLAHWRGAAGDAAGAVTACEQLLADRERVLGPYDTQTLTTRKNLARWRGVAGDAAGAATAYEQLLDDFLRVLGPDHVETLSARNNLAHWRGSAGDAAGAARAFQQLLDDFLRVLGPTHPHTLNTLDNLLHFGQMARDAADRPTE
ncbi:tetratricopeptide repeat protein [Streptomyces sp. NPDC002082]|uniref:tetratricopeptide repeat protein n=1 Tax=Streptomyces sp. NPDC002082 TaxID=3154772 RepID=UPI0033165A7A